MQTQELSLKEHQEIMLKLLNEFDSFCNKNDLRYFLTGGSLLGAVRHKGFIPWDDDVDIVMPRPDYDRLLKFETITNEIEIVSYKNKHGYYHPFSHTNIVDKQTIMKEDHVKKQTGKGIFLDVFPLDGIPDELKLQSKHCKKLMRLQSMLSIKISVKPKTITMKNIAKTVIGLFLKGMNENQVSEKINSIASEYKYDDSNYVAHSIALFGNPSRFITPKTDYDDYVLLPFEGALLRSPKGYDNILKRSYGDYMKLPPECDRYPQHGIHIYKR